MAKSKSRRVRFEEAVGEIGEPKGMIEDLRDELQEWLDNMPENLQGGEKAGQLENSISELDDMISSLEELECTDVEFPGMF